MRQNADAGGAAIRDEAAAWKARADAGLTPQEEIDLRDWLQSDPRHGQALARFDAVWETLDRPHHAGAGDRLLLELKRRARRRRTRLMSAMAGLGMLVLTGGLWRVASRPGADDKAPVGTGPAEPVRSVLHLPNRQLLPDGTRVELRDDAAIAVEFDSRQRRVVLVRGEAHFEVTQDIARPFVVVAAGIKARAVGTAFSVQIRPDFVEVLVTEGKVAVDQAPAPLTTYTASGPSSSPEQLALLQAGHRVVVDFEQAVAEPPKVTVIHPDELDERLAWRAPRVEFTRTHLSDALAMLNRLAADSKAAGRQPVRFVLGDPDLAGVRVSGLFRADRTDAFLGLLWHGFGIVAETRSSGEIVLRGTSSTPGR